MQKCKNAQENEKKDEMRKVPKERPARPVPVRIEDFRTDLDKLASRSELPPYILEMLLNEYLVAVRTVARKEYRESRAAWELACKEGEADGGHQ